MPELPRSRRRVPPQHGSWRPHRRHAVWRLVSFPQGGRTRDLARRRRGRLGDRGRGDRYHREHLVSQSRASVVEPARLGVRSGLDRALRGVPSRQTAARYAALCANAYIQSSSTRPAGVRTNS